MATRLQRLRRGGLSESFPFAGPAFRRAAPWLLAGVAFLGLIVRAYPALRYGVWGSDSGEYYYLTKRLVETGRITFDYDGWGLAYPYFPGMFVVSGAVHSVLGVDLFLAVQWTTPLVSAALPVLVGLLAYRVTSDPRAAVIAGAFVATSATIVITTSHAMPATLGQVMLFFLLALLPDAYRDRRHLPLLAIAGFALVLTHHFTTYFAVGILAFVPFYREMTQRGTDVQRLRTEIPLGFFLLACAGAWWLLVSTPFREQIVGQALPFPPWVTALLFVLALAALPALVLLKRSRTDWFKGPRYPTFQRQLWTAVATAVGFWLVVLFAVVVKLPGSEIRVDPIALLYVVPVLGSLCFLPLGISAMRFHKQGILALGALYAVLASLAFAIVTDSHVLFPFRHVDYMAMLMAPLLALGMLMLYDQTLSSRMPVERAGTRAAFFAGFATLLVLSTALSFPPRGVIGGFEEGIGENELKAVRWVNDHPDIIPPGSTFAADHRVSSLLFGMAGQHPTWDYTPRTYHAEDVNESLAELRAAKVPGVSDAARVDYVFLSPQIEQGVTLVQWENSRPMTEAAIAKFTNESVFQRVYDEEGVRIYRVNWTP